MVRRFLLVLAPLALGACATVPPPSQANIVDPEFGVALPPPGVEWVVRMTVRAGY